MSISPFFSYFGGKWRLAPRYPKPLHDTIIEPFAGGAGYSTRYHNRQIILVEKDPTVASMWRLLLSASAGDILALPEDGDAATGAARALIEFNRAQSASRAGSSRVWREGFHEHAARTWCRTVRARIASQVDKVRHWQIIEGDYTQAPDIEATWFIDPPYVELGTQYTQSAAAIDFAALGAWCRTRRGQVIVCENDGATWLPFRPFTQVKGDRPEVVWTNEAAA